MGKLNLIAALLTMAVSSAFAVENWTKAQQEVAAVFKVWAESEIAADVEREMSVLAPGFTAWNFAQPAPMDRAAFRQTTVDLFKQGKVTACVIQPAFINIEGATAVAHGRYSETVKDAAGVMTTMGGPWTASLIRSGEKWLVLGLGWTDDPPPAASSERELIKLEQEWAKAYVARDPKVLGRMEADDWVYTDADGNVITRAQDLADVESGTFVATSFVVDELKVRVYGDTAVVTGRQTMKATYKGKPANDALRLTDTWLRRDGRWQCIASQLTKLTEK